MEDSSIADYEILIITELDQDKNLKIIQ